MARGTPHTPELRAAVLADLLTGNALTWVAKKHHVSKSLVVQWRDEAGLHPEVRTKKRETYGELVDTYLRETVATLSVQVRFFRDETWLKEQSADDLATLHGVLLDRAVHILAALERPADAAPAPVDDAIDVGFLASAEVQPVPLETVRPAPSPSVELD